MLDLCVIVHLMRQIATLADRTSSSWACRSARKPKPYYFRLYAVVNDRSDAVVQGTSHFSIPYFYVFDNPFVLNFASFGAQAASILRRRLEADFGPSDAGIELLVGSHVTVTISLLAKLALALVPPRVMAVSCSRSKEFPPRQGRSKHGPNPVDSISEICFCFLSRFLFPPASYIDIISRQRCISHLLKLALPVLIQCTLSNKVWSVQLQKSLEAPFDEPSRGGQSRLCAMNLRSPTFSSLPVYIVLSAALYFRYRYI